METNHKAFIFYYVFLAKKKCTPYKIIHVIFQENCVYMSVSMQK